MTEENKCSVSCDCDNAETEKDDEGFLASEIEDCENIEAGQLEVMPPVVEAKKTKVAKDKKKQQIRKTTLCKLIKVEFQKKHMDEYIELVENPAWVCKKCGRTAKEKKSLCKPLPLISAE